jgi:hypothetical protein
MVATWCQIRAVLQMFEGFLLEALQELSHCVGTGQPSVVTSSVSSPRHFHVMAALTCSIIVQCAPALIILSCFMKSTNSTHS